MLFDSLPLELIEAILECTFWPPGIMPNTRSSREQLYESRMSSIIPKLALCNRKFYDIANPYLYRRLMLGDGLDSEIWTSPAKFGLLLRTFCSNPALAELVEEVYLIAPDVDQIHKLLEMTTFSNEYRRDLSRLTNKDLAWLQSQFFGNRAYIQYNSIKGSLEWFRELLCSRNWEPMLALLLTLVSKNLKFLTVDEYGTSHLEWLQALIHRAMVEQNGRRPRYFLSNLHQICVNLDSTRRPVLAEGCNAPRALCFANLRSVLTLALKGLNDIDGLLIGHENFLGSKELHLIGSTMDFGAEFCFFTRFRFLRTLYYVGAGSQIPTSAEPSRPDLINHLKPSLEGLMFLNPARIYVVPEPAFGELFEFKRLTYFGTSYPALFGNQISEFNFHAPPLMDEQISKFLRMFPLSLERLGIHKCPLNVFDCIAALLPVEGKVLPKLERVEVNYMENVGEARARTNWDYWVLRGQESGVRLMRRIGLAEIRSQSLMQRDR